MRYARVFYLIIFFLYGCATLSNFEYKGAGHFNNLVSYKNGINYYNDNPNEISEFDSIVLFHVSIIDYSKKLSDELCRFPIAMFRMTDEYLNSDPALKNEIYWKGDFAKYYHQYIYGKWLRNNTGNKLETYSIFGVKSKINEVILTKIRLEFSTSKWLDVSVNKKIKILPSRVNYLGTLLIELTNTGKYSGDIIKQAYFQYDTKIEKGYVYNTRWKFNFAETDFKRDKEMLKINYPNLLEKYNGEIYLTPSQQQL